MTENTTVETEATETTETTEVAPSEEYVAAELRRRMESSNSLRDLQEIQNDAYQARRQYSFGYDGPLSQISDEIYGTIEKLPTRVVYVAKVNSATVAFPNVEAAMRWAAERAATMGKKFSLEVEEVKLYF